MQKENLTSDSGSERNETREEERQKGRLNRNAIAVSLITDPATQIRLWKCTVSPTRLRSARTGDYVHGLRINRYFWSPVHPVADGLVGEETWRLCSDIFYYNNIY